jgi:PucR C-terminal helix-turn-helix domain/GGDEF-like domain
VDIDRPAVAELTANVAAAVSRRAATVAENVYAVTRREIPELHDDQTVLALFASSIDSNVTTCLQIMQHQIDLAEVHAPAAALEEARRRAQRGTPLTALLRAYRLGHTVFLDWSFQELARQSQDARMVTAVTMDMSKIVAGYVDQTSEEIVATYARERENWLRNRSAARAARIRDLLSGQLINVSATEATLGYRLRQHHVGVVCWTGAEAVSVDNITRLERAIGHIAAQTAAGADPVFLPRDESSAWAWLPLGIRDRFDAAASAADLDGDLHVAFGDVVKGIAGFRLTHQQALAAQAVALAGGSPPRVVSYGEVAPVAMMLGSADLLRAWVLSTLGGLASDDEHHARLRETLLVFLDTGGSYKTTAERLVLHKNSVQYRIRRAEESLGRPIGDNRHDVELALQAGRWLGSSVLRSPDAADGTTALPTDRPLTWMGRMSQSAPTSASG